MADYWLLIPLLIVVIVVLFFSKAFSKIVRYIGYGYFLLLSFVFVIVRERISHLYEHPPIPEIYWEKNSNWCDIGMFLFLVPTLIIFLISYISWLKREGQLKEKLLTLPFFIVVVVPFLLVYVFYFSIIIGYMP